MLRDASQTLAGAMGFLGMSSREPAGRDRMPTETYSQDDIQNGFRAEIRAPAIALGDRVKIGLASLFAVLLPVSVAALLALACGVWVQFTLAALNQSLPAQPLWIAAILAGDLFLLGFMVAVVRRLLMIRRNSKTFLTVTPQSQPELYAFVRRVARLLRVPAPRVIRLDAEVGLILRPGSVRGILLGSGPEIVIGLPLLYGLSARQLSGVIAHAYAGYTTEARRSGYPLLCAIDRWLFAQSGITRSAFAIRQELKEHRTPQPYQWLRGLALPFDLLVQGTFYLLYHLISAVTFVVTRRIDMAGDLFSARIAGSTEFRSTQFRLRSLHYGQQHAHRELLKRSRTCRLSDNFPLLVVNHADTLQLSLRPRLIQEMEELVTPLTRSRIVDLGRIVNVEQHQEEGACYLLGPAVALLREADRAACEVSLGHYRALGIYEPELVSAQRLVLQTGVDGDRANRNRVFGGLERSSRILRIDDFASQAGRNIGQRCGELAELIEKLHHDSAVIHHLADTWRQYDYRKNLLHTRKVVEESMQADEALVRDIETKWIGLIKEQSEVKAELVQYEALQARRVGLALSLAVENPEVPVQLGMSLDALRAHLTHLTDALGFLHRAHESVQRLRTYTQILGQLMVRATVEDSDETGPRQDELCHRYQKYVLLELASVLRLVNHVPHPMMVSVCGDGQAAEPRLHSIGEVIRLEVHDLDSADSCPEACHRVATAVLRYIASLNEQLQDRLSLLVSRSEQHYDLDAMSAEPLRAYSR